jgi:uncharacterized protein YndB with AHSA1/START domain
MGEQSVAHATFVIERHYAVAPGRVFAAWAQPQAKARWFVGPASWKLLDRELDFRVGGRERLRGTHEGGRLSVFDAHYLDIVADRRIIYSYDMHLNEVRISVSLATVEFTPAGAATRLVFAEQAAFLDGFDDGGGREHGTGALLDQLGADLKRNPPRT